MNAIRRIVAVASALLPIVATAQTLNVKTGAWEMSLKGSMMPKPMVYQECVTKADLVDMVKGPDKDDDCKAKSSFSQSGQRYVGDMVCADGGAMHVEVTAESPERIRATFVRSGKGGGGALDMTGRWLGASCAGIKE